MHTIFSHSFTHSLSPPPLSFLPFPSPLELLKLSIGRSWLVGLSGPLILMETPTYCWSKQSPQRDHPVLGLQSPGAPRNRKLVGGDWNMNFIFPNSWDDDPIWLIFICFRGVGIPPTRKAAESFFRRHYESLCLMIFDPYTHHVSSCFIDEVIMSMTPRGKKCLPQLGPPISLFLAEIPLIKVSSVVFCILF